MKRININKYILAALAAMIFFGLPPSNLHAQVKGPNVTKVEIGRGAKEGTVTQTGPKAWTHYHANGNTFVNYTETGRDEWSVYLRSSRFTSVIINLWQKTFVMKEGSKVFYQGKVLSSSNAAVGSATNSSASLEKQCFDAVQGKLVWNKTNGNKTWGASYVQELCKGTPNPANTIACFSQEIQTHNGWRRGIDACKVNPTVARATTAANTSTSPTANLEKQCFDAVQGKVAYDKTGNKSWGASNVQKLCKGTTNVAATIACFKQEVQVHNSWSRGVEACKVNPTVARATAPATTTVNTTLTTANRSATTDEEAFVDTRGAAPLSANQMSQVMQYIAVKVSAIRVPYCYRKSETRGAGKPLSNSCAPGLEKNGLLCYPKCKANFKGNGPVCWEQCAAGFTDIGAFCQKPKGYGRGVGFGWKIGDKPFNYDRAKQRCEAKHGANRCEKTGLIYYPKCKAGFKKVGANICSPICPAGQADTGTGCRKNSYGRTAGKPLACQPGMEQGRKTERSGLLCYPTCKNRDYKGVGPVCWQQCPSQQPVGCGFGCSTDKGTCASVVSDQVLSPIMAVVSLATLGSAAAANSAAKTAKAGLGGAAAVAKASKGVSKISQTALRVKKLIRSAKAWSTIAVGGTKNMQKLVKAGKMIKIGKKYFKAGKIVNEQIKLFQTEFSRDFANQTSPEIDAEIKRRFGPQGAEYVRQEWARNHLILMFEADAWATAKNALSLASIADPTGIASVVNAYMHPICKTSAVFPNVNMLHRQ